MKFTILTLFPEFFKSPFETSILKRAIDSKLIEVEIINFREFGEGKFKQVDDRPYGGGAGMVLMPQVLEKALQFVFKRDDVSLEARKKSNLSTPVFYLSPQGPLFNSTKARTLAQTHQNMVFVCGHYEGIDERALQLFIDEEISIGNYVLTGGEVATLVVIDSISRFIPNVVGDFSSVANDSLEVNSLEVYPGGIKAPVYTRPKDFHGLTVPEVLCSGNHEAIRKWRFEQSKLRTFLKRKDLVDADK
jgi:tRNA (guanine37-N1)-methyltransferase